MMVIVMVTMLIKYLLWLCYENDDSDHLNSGENDNSGGGDDKNDNYLSLHRTANNDRQPLEVGQKFWQLRESVVNCELLMLRVLGFCVAFDNPHKVRSTIWKLLNVSFNVVKTITDTTVSCQERSSKCTLYATWMGYSSVVGKSLWIYTDTKCFQKISRRF